MSHVYQSIHFTMAHCFGDTIVCPEHFGKLVDYSIHVLKNHLDQLDLVRLDIDRVAFIAPHNLMSKFNRVVTDFYLVKAH